ncbi:RNA-binding protein 7 isoform X2 [Telopea speciosissima]|uniref:RNA-binding protein 7 isoform X2 n=1 Tax=Telopea speciosissima TaxID=54955 RepID=UPI001CC4BC6C|nr:RNA-binding protein 7 isoform X2 [Telopea speciosissima]
MPGNPGCTVYIGNLDEKVSDKVLYEILIQVGRVVDLYIPRDKETNRPKGYAFAEYETEEVADYAVRLFSGLVTLYNRTLKFAISGQDKPSQNLSSPFTPTLNSVPKPRFHPLQLNGTESFQHPLKLSPSCSTPPNYAQEPPPPGYNIYRSDFYGKNYDYSRRVFGATLSSIGPYSPGRTPYDSRK